MHFPSSTITAANSKYPLIIIAKIVINNNGVNNEPIRSINLDGFKQIYKTTMK